MFKSIAAALVLLLATAGAGAGDFSLTDLQGRVHSLESHRGQWVILNVWATWCKPCLAEMPELEAFAKSRDDTVVIGLAADGQTPRRLAEFARQLEVTYPIVAGNTDMLAQLGVRLFPTTLVYSPSGERVLLQEGAITRKKLEEVLR